MRPSVASTPPLAHATGTNRPDVVVTGLGVVSSVGVGCAALWDAIALGRDGIRPVERFSTAPFGVDLAGTVPEFARARAGPDLHVHFAVTAAREALTEARLESSLGSGRGCGRGATHVVPAHRLALVVGTGLAHEGVAAWKLTQAIAAAVGAEGPQITVSTACASSTNALGLARDLLARGDAEAVLAGGVDVLTEQMFAGFFTLGALSQEKCAPFSFPSGTTLGEGAGFTVLEREVGARARGASPLAWLNGYGLSADAFDATAPDPTGAGVARAVQGALDDAGLEPGAVGYVNAHGTGTASNDPAESLALRRVFGARAEVLPTSSSKSMLGHAQGAAGVLEAIVTLLALRRGVIPPTLHFKGPRPRTVGDPVGQSRPRRAVVAHAVSNSSAFGGANASVVLGTLPAPAKDVERRRLRVAGVGVIGPHGLALEGVQASIARGAMLRGPVPALPLRSLCPAAAGARGLDPTTRYLIAAAALSRASAEGEGVPSRPERAGLVLGANEVSPASYRAFRDSVGERGIARLSVRAFAGLLLNAPAGACARLLGLRGAHSTVSTGRSSALVASAYAAELLSTRPELAWMIAAGVHESTTPETEAEGSACVLLGLAGDAPPGVEGVGVALAGWALAGPRRLEEAVERALAAAGLPASHVQATFGCPALATLRLGAEGRGHVDPARWMGPCGALPDAVALALAVDALRRGHAETAVVASARDSSASAALVLTRKEAAPTAWEGA
jgi:3-oxoacyl-[acyl-carrier-protein] synthase II